MRWTPDRAARVRANLLLGQPCDGVAILLVAPCYGNRNNLRPDGPHMQTLPLPLRRGLTSIYGDLFSDKNLRFKNLLVSSWTEY